MSIGYDAARNAARRSQETGKAADTRQWSYADRQTYFKNGGK